MATTEEPSRSVAADGTIAARIRAALEGLSAAEERVGRAILIRYPVAGLETTLKLAERAGVSPPTVVRFATALGFSGYREFQAALREEIQQSQAASPLTQADRGGTGRPDRLMLSRASDAFTEITRTSFTGFSDVELERALSLITDVRSPLWCIGGRFSRLLAEYLYLHLRLVRPGSRLVADNWPSRTDFMADVGADDVVVAFDYRRYQVDTVDAVGRAHERGARVVLFTDIWLSPIASYADVVFTADVEAPSAFDSLVGAMAVLEALISEVLPRMGVPAAERLRKFEEISGTITSRLSDPPPPAPEGLR